VDDFRCPVRHFALGPGPLVSQPTSSISPRRGALLVRLADLVGVHDRLGAGEQPTLLLDYFVLRLAEQLVVVDNLHELDADVTHVLAKFSPDGPEGLQAIGSFVEYFLRNFHVFGMAQIQEYELGYLDQFRLLIRSPDHNMYILYLDLAKFL